MKPRIAFIATGGTIASLGHGALDTYDYASAGHPLLDAAGILDRFPEAQTVADVRPVAFSAVPSTGLHFPTWKSLVVLCDQLVADDPGLAGIVIGHGTATLEETAYALHLTLKVAVPVVLVGSQRPASALSTDAGINLVNALRVVAEPASRGLGVLVVLNDEIHAARDVTKTSTNRLQTFRAPDFGALGHADGDAITYYRRPLRRGAPQTEFDIRGLEALPRVDISYAYAGADGTAVRAFLESGADGIVSAGFAPGSCAPGELEGLKHAVAKGVVVVQSSRAGSGRVPRTTKLGQHGFVGADNLNPQKARILLSLALSVTRDPARIAAIFSTY
ncbi:asparaginase [Neoroseomonas lacus]|uniref:L-asparaginase 2 n=1 Tax=Neoroseomonas lacus TaxID=287609 RepID=A0A917NYP2_9PROT|nr:asparaginase [Neoroseomonas lacus]GGJ41431.1 L-asparaginase 2 [Neoroseomonas lacus]